MTLSARVSGNEKKYLDEVLEGAFASSTGSKMTSRLEKEFAEVYGSKYAIAFTNGTATLHAALEAFGIGPGDEVIVPPLTMAATTFAVLQANATPVFADVDAETFQITAEAIEKCITRKTKAIITVALYGQSPDLQKIAALAKRRNLWLLEDNAECFLGKQGGRLVGTFGDVASYSFQSSKHLTSGEGGIVITDNEAIANKIRKIQSLGYAGVSAKKGKITKDDIQNPNYSRHISMGWNYRMPELCAAVALAQTERIRELVNFRISAASKLRESTSGFEHILKPQFIPDGYENSYWTFVAQLNTELISWSDFRSLFLELGGEGFYAAWKLTYQEPMFENLSLLGREKFISRKNRRRYKSSPCPVAETLQPKLVQFKTNYWNPEDASRQAEVLKKALKTISKSTLGPVSRIQ